MKFSPVRTGLNEIIVTSYFPKVTSYRISRVSLVLSVLVVVVLFNVLVFEASVRKSTLSVVTLVKRSVEKSSNWQRFKSALKLIESGAFNINGLRFDNITGAEHYVVPNIVHYVRFKRKSFTFVEYICLRSAYLRQKPDYIFIHTDVTSGFKGKYWDWIKRESGLEARVVIVPTEAPSEVFGRKFRDLWRLHHGSDVVRLQALLKYGGISLDNDAYVVQNLDKYRKYELTVGWPDNGTIGNMIVIANRGSRFLSQWLDNYRDYKADLWYYNAGDHPAELLALEPGLAHREMKRLGTHFLIRELYQEKLWSSDFSVNYDVAHLLVRHRSYLDMYFKDYRYFNERNVMHYPFTFGDMARTVLETVPFLVSNIKRVALETS